MFAVQDPELNLYQVAAKANREIFDILLEKTKGGLKLSKAIEDRELCRGTVSYLVRRALDKSMPMEIAIAAIEQTVSSLESPALSEPAIAINI